MKFILENIFVASQLVLGQSLWKIGVGKFNFKLNKEFILSNRFLSFLFSWQVLAGLLLYAVATLYYMSLLSKYQYSTVQAVVTPVSLVLAFTVSALLFGEKITGVNSIGFSLIVVGVILATRP
jgi:uncharacterized membrane protein